MWLHFIYWIIYTSFILILLVADNNRLLSTQTKTIIGLKTTTERKNSVCFLLSNLEYIGCLWTKSFISSPSTATQSSSSSTTTLTVSTWQFQTGFNEFYRFQENKTLVCILFHSIFFSLKNESSVEPNHRHIATSLSRTHTKKRPKWINDLYYMIYKSTMPRIKMCGFCFYYSMTTIWIHFLTLSMCRRIILINISRENQQN